MTRFKKLTLAAGVLVTVVGVVQLIGTKSSYAYDPVSNGGANVIQTGAFSSPSGAQIGDSIPDAVNDATSFKNYISGLLAGAGAYGIPGSDYNRFGAAFIIETMLHGQGTYSTSTPGLIAQAQADYATWASLVDQYSADGKVAWNTPNTYGNDGRAYPNSEHVCTGPHHGCSSKKVYEGPQDAQLLGFFTTNSPEGGNLIVFYNPDGTTFSIRRNCANPLGGTSPIRDLNKTPIGSFDQAVCKTSSGWAFDPDDSGDSINVFVIVNGTSNGPFLANQSRPDVDTTYGIGGNHGFSVDTSTMAGFNPLATNTVQVYAQDAQTGEHVAIGGSKTTPSVCATASCGTTTFPHAEGSFVAVGEPESFYLAVNIDPPSINPVLRVTVKDPSNNPVPPYVNAVEPYTHVGSTIQTLPLSFTPTVPGRYTVNWTTDLPATNCNDEGYAGYQPFVSVLGGDAAIGPGFGAGCTTSMSAGITTYDAAGSQLATLANGDLKGFSTSANVNGSSSLGAAALDPSALAYANTSPPKSGTVYGGEFNLTNWCLPNYASDAAAGAPVHSAAVTTIGSAAVGTTVYNGNVILNSLTLPADGKTRTIVVNGNAYINGNINYAAYSAISQIPQFQLLVRGSIYIDGSVTKLTGLYTAQPTSAGGSGTLYTCANVNANLGNLSAVGPLNGDNDAATIYTDCNKPLVFSGAVAAAQLILGRTIGNPVTVGGITRSPAETFQMSPEIWLKQTSQPSKWQSVTSLPPIL